MDVKKITWNAQAESVLKPALHDAEPQIKKEVECGVSELWKIDDFGFLVTRIEVDSTGKKEMVFVAGAGKNTKQTIRYFIERAKAVGVKNFRLHTKSKAFGRLVQSIGFEPVETVYKVVI